MEKRMDALVHGAEEVVDALEEQQPETSSCCNASVNIERVGTGCQDKDMLPETVGIDEHRRLVAEAEQRGYLRGRNEQIELMINESGPEGDVSQVSATDDDDVMILRYLRRSKWF